MSVVVVVAMSLVAFAILVGLLALATVAIETATNYKEEREMELLLLDCKLKALKRQVTSLPELPEGGQSYRDLPDNVVRFKAHPVELALALGLINPEDDPDEGHSQR